MPLKTLQPFCELMLYSSKGVTAFPERTGGLVLDYLF